MRLRWLAPALALLVALWAAAVDPAGFREQARLGIFDHYQRMSPRPYVDAGVRIVDIDDESLAKLGQWPWPRDLMARLATKLAASGARAIVFDMVFAEPDRTSPRNLVMDLSTHPERGVLASVLLTLPDHDTVLADAIRQAGNVVVGFMLKHEAGGGTPHLRARTVFNDREALGMVPAFDSAVNNLPAIEAAAVGAGHFAWLPDRDRVLRRMPTFLRLGSAVVYPSLSIETLRVISSANALSARIGSTLMPGLAGVDVGDRFVPTNLSGEVELHFTGPVAERYIPAWKVLSADFDPRLVSGKILFIGTSASGLHDDILTPLQLAMPGVEGHVQALEQMLLGAYLHRSDWIPSMEAIFSLILGGLLILVLMRLSTYASVLTTVLVLAAVWSASWFAYERYQWLLDPVLPTIFIIVVFLAGMIIERARLERSRLGGM